MIATGVILFVLGALSVALARYGWFHTDVLVAHVDSADLRERRRRSLRRNSFGAGVVGAVLVVAGAVSLLVGLVA